MEYGERLLFIIVQTAVGLLAVLVFAYLKRKGDNLAKKEDITGLTKQVEEIKNEFQKDTEKLKADLAVLTDRKTQVFNVEKDALITFYTEFNEWLWAKCNVHIFDYNRSNYEQIQERIIQLEDQYNKVQVAQSRIDILVENNDILKVSQHLITETLKLHQFVVGICKTLKTNLSHDKGLMETLTKDEGKSFREAPLEWKKFIEERAKKVQNEYDETTKEYYEKFNGFFRASIDIRFELQNLIKKHLRSA